MSGCGGPEQTGLVDKGVPSQSLGAMLYEITTWRRTASAPQLLETRHELGRLAQIKEIAKTMLRDTADANALYFVRVAEAHNGREAFVCRFDQLG